MKLTEVKILSTSLRKYYFLIGILTFFVFANTILNGYNLDDELVTRNHPLTSQGLKAIGEIFKSPYYSDGMGYSYGFRPIVLLSFAIEHEIFGENVIVSHSVNLLLYIICVLLFFTFLLKCFGEENKWFIIIAVLYFAVHPVHSEVVASIKNRDEILAFLFVVASGISTLKFLNENKINSFLFVFIFFTLAMLSKKSVFPMVLILPTMIVFFKEISLKKLILISILYILPGAIIGFELELKMIFYFVLFSLAFLFFIYFFKKEILKNPEFELKKLIMNPISPFILSVVCSFYAIYTNDFNLILISFTFLIWLIYTNTKVGVITLTVILTLFDLNFQSSNFSLVAIFISFSYFTPIVYLNRKFEFYFLIPFFAIVYFLIYYHFLIEIIGVISIVIFFFLVIYKFKFGVVFCSLVFGIYMFFSKESSIYPYLMLSVVLVQYFSKFKLKYNHSVIISLLMFGFLCTHSEIISRFSFSVKTDLVYNTTQFENRILISKNQNSFIKKNRPIQYVENTLVEPYTTSQLIGTGVQTLCEYLKLMVFPYELSFYYGFSKTKTVDLNNFEVWISLVFYLGLVYIAIFQIKKRPIIFIGIVWYILSILLFSNWIELVAGMVGERLAFTASAGFSIFLAGLVFWSKPDFNFKRPKILELSVIVVLILFSIRTISRNSDWKGPLTLMGNDIKHLQNSAQANNLYGLNLMNISTNDESYSQAQRFKMQQTAVKHFKKAVNIYPKFSNAWFDLGRSAFIIGDTISAIKGFENSISLNPQNLDAYYLLLNLFEIKNSWDKHLKYSLLLFEINKDPSSYILLSLSFVENNMFIEAKQILEQGINSFPRENQLKSQYESLMLIKKM
jgi:tetratricopeptide (TPR) repeat protein